MQFTWYMDGVVFHIPQDPIEDIYKIALRGGLINGVKKNILRECIMDFGGNWDNRLSLIASIQWRRMKPYTEESADL